MNFTQNYPLFKELLITYLVLIAILIMGFWQQNNKQPKNKRLFVCSCLAQRCLFCTFLCFFFVKKLIFIHFWCLLCPKFNLDVKNVIYLHKYLRNVSWKLFAPYVFLSTCCLKPFMEKREKTCRKKDNIDFILVINGINDDGSGFGDHNHSHLLPV